jgi:cytochrome c oxidase subunit 4
LEAEEEDVEAGHASGARYVLCWLALAILTVVTLALSSVHLGEWSFAIAMMIAVSKASVVALFFMHLWDHTGASRLVFAVSVLFLGVVISLVLVDIMTRFPPALPAAIHP